jgi:prepilin-type N-terminal cleavage/methylation domain-containing protein
MYMFTFRKELNPPLPPFCKGGLRGISLGRGGFTLLEILISIAIMSIILVALYSTYLLAHKALFDVDKSLVKLQEARAFADIMKREIEASLYSQDNTYCVFKMHDRDFYGKQASSLTMTTSSPLMKGLAKINYTVEERDGVLIITKSMVSAITQASEETRVDLLEDIESFTLQAKYQDAWVKTWDSSLSKRTPDEVKLTLTMRMTEREKETRSGPSFSISETAKLRIGSTL